MYSSDRRYIFNGNIYYLFVELKIMESKTRKSDPSAWGKATKKRKKETGKEYNRRKLCRG
jgi:hypothetical protein